MKRTGMEHFYHACMGTAILLLSIHAVYVGVHNLNTAVEVFRMEYFFEVPFCIDHIVFLGLAVSAALMLLSGGMGILTFANSNSPWPPGVRKKIKRRRMEQYEFETVEKDMGDFDCIRLSVRAAVRLSCAS